MSLPNQPARPSGSKPSVTPQSPNGSGKPAPHPSKRHRWAPAADGPPDRRAQPSGRAGLQPPLPSAQHIFQEQVELEHPANRSRPAGPRRLPYFYQFTERPTFTREAQQWQAMQPPRSPPTAWWQRQQHPANGATSAQPQEPAARPLPKPALKSKAITREVAVPRDVTVGQLAQLLGTDIDKLEAILSEIGEKVSSHEDRVSPDSIELAAMEFDKIAVLPEASRDLDVDAALRPAVVTIMGHVDHGKTSLLDALRETAVAAGEFGGITQHIGAFEVPLPDSGTSITFLDTPGHAAFSSMRARGASVTDVVVLVVAADDGVMPQTKEALGHAVAAGCPIVVAITKCDRPDADPEKVKRQLQSEGLELEEAGGSVQVVLTSAAKREGLSDLESALLLQSELMGLKASPSREAEGIVVEAKLDKGQGPVATVIIKHGTLRVADVVVVGTEWGRVKSLKNGLGLILSSAKPGMPAEIAGLKGVPMAGDELMVLSSEDRARRVSEARAQRAEEYRRSRSAAAVKRLLKPVEELQDSVEQTDKPQIAISIKADVQGSAEAIEAAIKGLENEAVGIKITSLGLGPMTTSDVDLAANMDSRLIAFNTPKPHSAVLLQAKQKNVDIASERVIYHLLTRVQSWMADALPKVEEEHVLGQASVLQVFTMKGGKAIAGCRIADGQVLRANRFRVFRDEQELHCGSCSSLKREKMNVEMVAKGFECGVLLDAFHDYQPGDVLQCFRTDMVAPSMAQTLRKAAASS